jgi:oligoendopeptidase F
MQAVLHARIGVARETLSEKHDFAYNALMTPDKKKPRFNYEEMKAGALHKDRAVRKKAFQEYFERFEEFPSYLFDNEREIAAMLLETIQDIENDPATSKAMHAGVAALLNRLPSRSSD